MLGMTAEEVYNDRPQVTYVEAQREVYRYAKGSGDDAGLMWQEFLSDVGDMLTYDGYSVIGWLGY